MNISGHLPTVRRLLTSPLARKVAIVVFLTIVLVEIVILLPSYVRREDELLETLRQHATQWADASAPVLEATQNVGAYLAAVTRSQYVTGVQIRDAEGGVVAEAGEPFDSRLIATDPRHETPLIGLPSGDRYEFLLDSPVKDIGTLMMIRADSEHVRSELVAYVLRIIGLVLIISVFLTAATLLAINSLVIQPLIAIRDSLANRVIAQASNHLAIDLERKDEIGDHHRAMALLLDEVAQSKRELEQRVDERTSELRDANDKIIASEKRFRDYAATSADYFWEMDSDLRFSYFSTRFSEVTGVPTEELLGKTRAETRLPDLDPKIWLQHLDDLESHRSFRNFVHTRTRADGSVVYLSINGDSIFDDNGEFIGYRGTGKDITQNKLAEAKLIETNDRLKASQQALADQSAMLQRTLDSIDQGFAVWDADHRLVVWSRRCVDFWYDPPEDMLRAGMEMKELLRHLADHGAFGDGDPEKLASARYDDIKTSGPSSNEIVELRDGRILEIQRHPMPDGRHATTYTDVSARKKAEREVIEAKDSAAAVEALLTDALENISEAFLIYDADDRLVRYNSNLIKLYGYDPDDIWIGITFEELVELDVGKGLVQPRNHEGLAYGINRSEARLRQTDPIEFQLTNGRWLSVQERPTSGGGIVSIQSDITERKRSEEALRTSEARFNSFMNNSPSYIYLKSVDGRYLFVNKHVEESLGLPVGEVVGRKNTQLGYPEDLVEKYKQQDRDVIEGRETVVRELDVPHADGRMVPSLIYKFPVFGDDDEVEAIGAVIVDITDRVEAEKDAREKKRTLELILDNMAQGLTLYDSEWNLIAYNRTYAEQFDLPLSVFREDATFDDVVGATMRNDYGDEAEQRLAVVRDPSRMTKVWRRTFGRPNGRHLDIVSRPVSSGGFVVTTTDITETTTAQNQLAKTKRD